MFEIIICLTTKVQEAFKKLWERFMNKAKKKMKSGDCYQCIDFGFDPHCHCQKTTHTLEG